MISQISKALASGFTPKQVIDYILKKFPNESGRIKDAMAAGFTVDQVLKFISGGKKALANIETQPDEGSTEFQQTRNRDIGRREEVNKRAMQGAGLAATAIAAPMAASAASSALSRSLPQSLQRLVPELPNAIATSMSGQGRQPVPQQQGLPLESSNQTLPQQPPSNPIAASIPEPNNIQQPKGFDTNIIKNGIAYKNQIDALINSGNGPQEIEAYLKKFNPSFIKTIEKEGGGAFKDVVSQYMQEKMRDDAMEPQGSIPNAKNEQVQPQLQEAEQLQEPIQEKPKIEKNSVVSSPNGVGEVKEIRNGQAIVEVDGKLHKVKEEELEAPPIPEKELSTLFDDLMEGIEKETGEDVSRMVQWAGYNPEKNTLQFLPHTGDMYTYDNISEEDASLLTDILSTRKTTGSNFIGAWKKDSKSPIGAAMSKLIRKLQAERGGKGNEYSAKHGTIYSAYEPAIQAKKKKKK